MFSTRYLLLRIFLKKEEEKDTLIESPARVSHCLYNYSDEDFRILLVKIPKPKKSTELL